METDKASVTAYRVVQGIVLKTLQPEMAGVVPEEWQTWYVKVLETTPDGPRYLARVQSPWGRRLMGWLEQAAVPGMSLHYVLRKRAIEAAVRARIAQGATQVINLGAGFDMLAHRLSLEFPLVTFFELDHPATSAHKARFFGQPGVRQANLHQLPVDFTRQTAAACLRESPAFDASRPTVLVCEGVLPYLTEAQVRSLFDENARLFAPPVHLVFTFVRPFDRNQGDQAGLLLKLYLLLKKEPLNWTLTPAHLAPFVAGCGWHLEHIATPQENRDRFLPAGYQGPLLASELVAQASYAGSGSS